MSGDSGFEEAEDVICGLWSSRVARDFGGSGVSRSCPRGSEVGEVAGGLAAGLLPSGAWALGTWANPWPERKSATIETTVDGSISRLLVVLGTHAAIDETLL
jgi:hypothetical protein